MRKRVRNSDLSETGYTRAKEARLDRKLKRDILGKAIGLGVCIAVAATFYVLSLNTAVSEWFATHTSRAFVWIAGHISSMFPFSLFELGIVAAIIAGVTLLVLIFVDLAHRRRRKALDKFLTIAVSAAAVLCVYVCVATVQYNRKPIDLDMWRGEFDNGLIYEAASKYYEDFAATAASVERDADGIAVCPYTLDELSDRLSEEYKRLDGNDYFSKYTPRAKGIVNGWFMSQTSIMGITFVPLGEPTINPIMPLSERAATMAHEMAHAKGVMEERDANLVASYILLTSDDAYLHYCGFLEFECFADSLRFAGMRDEIKALEDLLPAGVAADKAYVSDWWRGYGLFSKIGNMFNDLYLKLSGIEEGTGSYIDTPDYGDSGKTDEDGNKIYEITSLSNLQRVAIQHYLGN